MFPMSFRRLTAPLTVFALGFIALTCAVAHAQQTVLPLWPTATPEPAQTTEPEADVTKDSDALISGHRSVRLANVTKPTLTVYPAHSPNGAAALVFPGGGYQRLAWTGEGTDVCDWLNGIGVTCILVKYRVPQPKGDAGHYPADFADLEDAQQAMRLTRAHAAEWHIDPAKVGVIGFSAGANLAALMSTHPDDHHIESTPAAAEADPKIDARANFAIIVYPAYLALDPDLTTLDPTYTPNAFTPPTFLLQAENDKSYGRNAPVYYQALATAKVPAELHMFATGGHGFGVHPAGMPEEHWTTFATYWLRSISMIPPAPAHHADDKAPLAIPSPAVNPMPCPNQPPNPNEPPRPPGTPCI